ncbi:MAG: helix-turn-helix transcriptional regulator [Clostridia bacterium]|nr:helix-turn-helix transcriptional regulator [Clostridia bacterium]
MITNIGDKIRYLRDKSGFTQSYLAKRLGISRSAVNSWEMSLSSPSLSNIIEMMDIFHVTADYLLGTSDKMMVDVSKLSSEEQEVIIKLVNCLNNPSKQL